MTGRTAFGDPLQSCPIVRAVVARVFPAFGSSRLRIQAEMPVPADPYRALKARCLHMQVRTCSIQGAGTAVTTSLPQFHCRAPMKGRCLLETTMGGASAGTAAKHSCMPRPGDSHRICRERRAVWQPLYRNLNGGDRAGHAHGRAKSLQRWPHARPSRSSRNATKGLRADGFRQASPARR